MNPALQALLVVGTLWASGALSFMYASANPVPGQGRVRYMFLAVAVMLFITGVGLLMDWSGWSR